MKWLDEKVSFYNSRLDNRGKNDFTFRNILFTKFAVPHEVWDKELEETIVVNDLETIVALGKLDRSLSDFESKKGKLKSTLQAYTPAALLASREKDKVVEIERTGIAQIDCDGKDNPGADMKQLKIDLFNTYDFIAFAGMSASGDGFYLLIAIAEPDKLAAYVEQLFWFFKKCNIVIDTTKGRKVHDLRYVSYDSDMKYREDPEPLKINAFFKAQEVDQETKADLNKQIVTNPDKVAEHWLKKLRAAALGSRMQSIQSVASALGSKRKEEYRTLLLQEIKSNSIFEDQRQDFIKSANKIFEWGWDNQLEADKQASP